MTSPVRHPALALVLGLFLAAQLGACSRDEPPAAENSAPAAAAQEAAAPAKPAEAPGGLDQKLGIYIDCYNDLDGRVHDSIRRYSSWIKDMQAGPTGKEVVVYGLYEIGPEQKLGNCRTQFDQAAGMSPALALDGAGKAYMEALDQLQPLVSEAHRYYDRENYKDDQFAQGKALHPRLKAAMESFMAASGKFSDAIELENDKRLEAQMQRLEKEEGRQLPYLHMATMHEAKLLMRMLGEESFPADQAATRLAAYEKITDELLAQLKAQPAEGMSAHNWSFFSQASEDFRKAAKERVRRVRDQVPYSTGEQMMLKPGSDWMVEGSPGKALKTYNTLVERSNNL